MRILALDVGSKSIGFAISDESKIIATALENFLFDEGDWEKAIKQTLFWLNKYEVEMILIGRPTLPSGDSSKTTIMIENFAKLIKTKINIPFKFVNENLSTKKACSIMIEAGMTRKKRKQHKDKLAAVIILQEYLQFI